MCVFVLDLITQKQITAGQIFIRLAVTPVILFTLDVKTIVVTPNPKQQNLENFRKKYRAN